MTDFSIELVMKVPRMTLEDAEKYLAKLDITDAERAILLSRAGTKLPPRPVEREHVLSYRIDPDRPNWLVAAYLLGASLRQLASLHGVQHTTIYQSINKTMPEPERTLSRLKFAMSFEDLSQHHHTYYNNLSTVRGLTPTEVAHWLNDNTELDK